MKTNKQTARDKEIFHNTKNNSTIKTNKQTARDKEIFHNTNNNSVIKKNKQTARDKQITHNTHNNCSSTHLVIQEKSILFGKEAVISGQGCWKKSITCSTEGKMGRNLYWEGRGG